MLDQTPRCVTCDRFLRPLTYRWGIGWICSGCAASLVGKIAPQHTHPRCWGAIFVVYRAGTMIATMMKVSTISPENATAPHAQARRFAS